MRRRIVLIALVVMVFAMLVPAAARPPRLESRPSGNKIGNERLFLVDGSFAADFASKAPLDSIVTSQIHDYDGMARVVTINDPDSLPPEVRSRLTPLEDSGVVDYRSWHGSTDVMNTTVDDGRDGYFVVSLALPLDMSWRERVTNVGATIVDVGAPYSLVVRATEAQLQMISAMTTSSGFDAVRGIQPVPREARLDSDLADVVASKRPLADMAGIKVDVSGRMVVKLVAYSDKNAASVYRAARRIVEPAPTELAYDDGEFLANPTDIDQLLAIKGVAYIELEHVHRVWNNLAALPQADNVQPAWTTGSGYTGSGVVVLHNDSGIDLGMGDFPSGVVTATNGSDFSNAGDNGHGTHTAGSVAGRGLATQDYSADPGLGGRATPSTPVRGMAFGATLVSNNLFNGGATSEASMMQWGSQRSAALSTNSWGYTNAHGYSTHARAVDVAVRDADSATAGNQQMTILFAAGNDGSGAGTVGDPGTGKNVITVGATGNIRSGSYIPSNDNVTATANGYVDHVVNFSGRGPSQGRIKPDVCAVGADVLSSQSRSTGTTYSWDQSWTGAHYALDSGTSMATPITAGATADFVQFYKSGHGGTNPSPALVKAALINGATDMGYGFPSNTQGWGRLNLMKSIQGPSGGTITFIEQGTGLATGASSTTTFNVTSSGVPLKITVVWTDAPGTAGGTSNLLINDLNLVVTSPSGTVYRGNQFTGSWSTTNPSATDTANNVENVFVQSPATGTWTVQVTSARTSTNPQGVTGQDFSLVYSGATGTGSPTPDFSLSASPSSVSALQGANTTSTITSSVSGGFNAAVALSASGVPSGATATFAPTSIAAPGSGSSTLTLGAGTAAAGTYNITVTGTGGSLTRTTTVAFTVTATGGCSSSTSPIVAGTPASGTFASTDCTSAERAAAGKANCFYDLFTFSATAGTQVTIVMTSTAVDTFLYLKSSGGTVLASDDDGNGGTNSKIVYTTTAADTLTIQATEWQSATGSYTVTLTSSGGGGGTTVLSEGAESGATGWTTSTNTTSNNWVISANGRRTGANGFRTNNATTSYVNNLDQSLISPVFSLAGKSTASLAFFYKQDTETNYDFFKVEVSTDGGATWGTALSNTSGRSTGFTQTAGSGMISKTVSLNSYAGQANVKVRFRFTSDVSVVRWGVALDDISVTAQ